MSSSTTLSNPTRIRESEINRDQENRGVDNRAPENHVDKNLDPQNLAEPGAHAHLATNAIENAEPDHDLLLMRVRPFASATVKIERVENDAYRTSTKSKDWNGNWSTKTKKIRN